MVFRGIENVFVKFSTEENDFLSIGRKRFRFWENAKILLIFENQNYISIFFVLEIKLKMKKS